MTDKCLSCQTEVANDQKATRFKCPNCGKTAIVRCSHCREIGARYECPECGFKGPN